MTVQVHEAEEHEFAGRRRRNRWLRDSMEDDPRRCDALMKAAPATGIEDD
jgi:hypothetical protein